MKYGNKNPHEGMFIKKGEKLIDGRWTPVYMVYCDGKLICDTCISTTECETEFFRYTGRNRPK